MLLKELLRVLAALQIISLLAQDLLLVLCVCQDFFRALALPPVLNLVLQANMEILQHVRAVKVVNTPHQLGH